MTPRTWRSFQCAGPDSPAPYWTQATSQTKSSTGENSNRNPPIWSYAQFTIWIIDFLIVHQFVVILSYSVDCVIDQFIQCIKPFDNASGIILFPLLCKDDLLFCYRILASRNKMMNALFGFMLSIWQ